MTTHPNSGDYEMQSLIRPSEELEGSLIAPSYVASPYGNSSAPAYVLTAVPVILPFEDNPTTNKVQYAEFLPSYEQLDSHRIVDTDDDKIRVGKEIGQLKAEAELEQDRKGMRNAYAKNYHESEIVKFATLQAEKRDKEGLEIKEDHFHKGVNTIASSNERKDTESVPYPKGGYKVSDYETSEYDCSDYNTTEYKSVYD